MLIGNALSICELAFSTLRMHRVHILLFLFIPRLALSKDVNNSKVEDREGGQNKEGYPSKIMLTVEDILNTKNETPRILSRLTNRECRTEWEWEKPVVEPADSDHIWVFWNWELSYHCNPQKKVIITVDGDEHTIHLTSDYQNVAYVKADPCLTHEVTLKAFGHYPVSDVTHYNSKQEYLYSGFLYATLCERTCFNKDKTTVTILEPVERLRSCIITRGKQELKNVKKVGSAISGNVTLTIIDPRSADWNHPSNATITMPVIGIEKCEDEEEGKNPDPTQTNQSDKENKDSSGSTAAIAIPLTIVALIIVSLAVGFIFWKKQKHKQRLETEAPTDENPVYGEYEVDENGEVQSETTAEVIDSSPYYGESVEGWEGATIKDQNIYYDS